MVVNCLPLYDPPDEDARAAAAAATNDVSDGNGQKTPKQSGARSTLIKARSMESIASSQLGDEDTNSKEVGEVATPPRRKGSKFAHYSVTVHDKPTSSAAETTTPTSNGTVQSDASEAETTTPTSTGTVQSDVGEAETTTPTSTGTVQSDVGEAETTTPTSTGTVQSDAGVAEPLESNCDVGQEKESEPDRAKNGEREKSDPQVNITVEAAEEESSDDEGEGEKVPEESEVVKRKPKNKEEGEHPRLQKTRSQNFSQSPERETSDSEENGFSVKYIQDSFISPQLKRSSGSVSFYAPAIPSTITASASGASAAGHDVKDETLLEDSMENKLEDTTAEKQEEETTSETPDEKVVVATLTVTDPSQSEAAGRDKSLSTAKPPLLKETDSFLQTSATSSSPSAPAQSSSSPLTAPPFSPTGAVVAQAPPLKRQQTLQVTPLPSPPITLDRDYVERSGWLNKLSHRKGVFGDKWQKRYFVLHRSWLYYFKKYGVCYHSDCYNTL